MTFSLPNTNPSGQARVLVVRKGVLCWRFLCRDPADARRQLRAVEQEAGGRPDRVSYYRADPDRPGCWLKPEHYRADPNRPGCWLKPELTHQAELV